MAYCSECSVSVPDDATHCPACGAFLEATEVAEVAPPAPPELDLDRLQATLSASLSPTYEVLKPLGQGGMGAIFLAKEPALKRLVAVKVLAPQLAADNNARQRFEREARSAAAISHPNVVRVFAVGQTKRTKLPYIIMQFIDGPNLEEWRLRRGRLSEREARRVIGEVAAALAAAHERDLVHRDVKPSNVLLESETGRAFVADFGVSAALSSDENETRLTHTGAIIGTPTYMSPEQSASDPVTPSSDVYSLGVVAYELLTGELPFSANSPMGWAAAHLRDTPTPTAECRPEVSPAIAEMVDRCLAKASDDRPAAGEIARALLPSLETEIEWPPPGLQWLLGRGRFVNRLALLAAAGAGVAALAWSFVPEILLAGADWLRQFEIAPEFSISVAQTRSDLSNTAVLVMFLWQVALTVGLVVYGVAGLGFLSTASRTVDRIIRQRCLGWRISTLLDVIADHDGRSGMVIAGTGDFGSFKEPQRKRILWSRRGAFAAISVGAFWIIAAFAVRSLFLVFGLNYTETTSTLLGTFDVALILAPGGLFIALGMAFRLLERQVLGTLGRQHSFDAEPDDVSRWYESLGKDAKPAAIFGWAQDRFAVWSLRFTRLALFLVVPIVAITLALGSVATLTAGRFSGRFGSGAAELLATLEDINREDPIGTARAAWLQYLPPRDSASGSLENDWMLRMRANLREPDAFPPYGVPLAEFFEWNSAERSTDTEVAFVRAIGNAIAPDTVAMLASLANHPRTLFLRRLASDPSIELWDTTNLPENSDTSSTLRSIAMTVTEAARANVLAAVYDATQGNMELAAQRLGENAAIGENLLRTPRVAANRLATNLLSNQALQPLASLERARGNAESAVQLERAAQQMRLSRRYGNAAGLAPDPNDFAQFIAAVTEPRVPAGYRVSWLRQSWAGLCAHPREILLGPSAERRARMQVVVDAMAEVPRVSDDAEFFEAEWRWPTTTRLDGPPGSSARVRLVDRLFVGTLYRVLACVVIDNP